jgi:hypothetical protein
LSVSHGEPEDGLAVHLFPEDVKGLIAGWRDDRHAWIGA